MKTFRTFVSWLTVIICLMSLTTACSNDDDNEIPSDNPLLGAWTYKDNVSGYEETITFYANGTCKIIGYYKQEDTTISINVNGSYTYENNILTIVSQQGIALSWRVDSITSQSMILTDMEEEASVTYYKA